MGERPHRNALRRYPALGFLAIAAALALLLPSRLSNPRSDPASLAEFAPVPGGGEGRSDLAGLSQASSEGVDATVRRRTPSPDRDLSSRSAGLGQPNASRRRCVGKPPRQTEDPLSPPCVPFFDGSNGGATTPGVTETEVGVVVFAGPATERAVADADDPDARTSNAQEDIFLETIRAFGAYFNARYEFYGRRLHLYVARGPAAQPADAEATVRFVQDEAGPFALVPVGSSDNPTVARVAANRRILAVEHEAFDRAFQQRSSPYLLTYTPDLQVESDLAAGFVCSKLAGRTARFSGNPGASSRRRRFGVIYYDDPGEQEYVQVQQMFRDKLAACGERDVPASAVKAGQDSPAQHQLAIADLKSRSVTTLVPFAGPGSIQLMATTAGSQQWYPEVLLPGSTSANGVDRNAASRTYHPAVWANAFGISFDRRREERTAQPWFQAYLEGCACTTEPATGARPAALYDLLVELAWGIQGAGPRLTPANLSKGLASIPPRPNDPTVPTAYFGSGDYSWIKDAMAIWWDAQGVEPGGTQPGCYRLADGGARHLPGGWTGDDMDLKVPGAPCQGPR